MLLPYRIPTNSYKNDKVFQIVSMTSKDLKLPQMSSEDLNWPQKDPLQVLKLLNLRTTIWRVV